MTLTKKNIKALLIGTYSAAFDKNQKITLPAEWRKHFVGKIFAVKGYDGCIELRNKDEMEKFSEQISSLSAQHKNNRIHKRFCMGSVVFCVMDGKGRIAISSSFLKSFAFGKDIMLIGVGSHVEIWDADVYEKWKSDNDVRLEDTAWVL